MATVCTVAGTNRTSKIQRGSVKISKTANGRDTFSCVFISKTSGSIYRPSEGEELTYSIEGSLPSGFGGTIVSVTETAIKDPNVGWACRVDAVNFTEWLDLIMVDDVWIANGLWDRVYYYWLNFISQRFPGTTYGGGAISGGDPLPASTYALRTLQDVFEEMAQMTDKIFNIGGDKVVGWSAPGAVAGPVTLSQTNSGLVPQGSAQGVSRKKQRMSWFTRGYMKVSAPEGTDANADVTITNEIHTSDGIVAEWPLKNRPVNTAPTQIKINGGATINLPGSTYSYDASKKAIIKAAPLLAAGSTITILSYVTKYPITVVYDDQKTSIRETILGDAEPGTTLTQAYEIAKYHVQFSAQVQPQEVVVATRTNGFYVGMAATMNFAVRSVTGTYWVQSIEISDIPSIKSTNPNRHWYRLNCVEGNTFVNPWQKNLKNRLGGGSGGGRGSSAITLGTSGGGGGGMAGSYPLNSDRNAGGFATSGAPLKIGNRILINFDAVPAGATVQFRAGVRTDNAGTSVTAVLRRVTGSGSPAAASTTVASTSTAYTELIYAFTPVSGWQIYELEVYGSNASAAVYATGVVDVLTV